MVDWRDPPAGTLPLPLPPGDIHIWRVNLARPGAEVAALAPLLHPDEAARAARFHFARDRRRYTVARAALRLILGRYLGQPPAGINIGYAKHGKPHLPHHPALQFNLAHAHELALLALAPGRVVGIDLEYRLRPLPDRLPIAQRFFAPAEYAALQALPPAQQPAAFLNGWTRKEAFIKALGEGLTHPLNSFTVTLRPGEPARFLDIGGDPAGAAHWSLLAFDPAGEYVAALATPGPINHCHYWHFN